MIQVHHHSHGHDSDDSVIQLQVRLSSGRRGGYPWHWARARFKFEVTPAGSRSRDSEQRPSKLDIESDSAKLCDSDDPGPDPGPGGRLGTSSAAGSERLGNAYDSDSARACRRGGTVYWTLAAPAGGPCHWQRQLSGWHSSSSWPGSGRPWRCLVSLMRILEIMMSGRPFDSGPRAAWTMTCQCLWWQSRSHLHATIFKFKFTAPAIRAWPYLEAAAE